MNEEKSLELFGIIPEDYVLPQIRNLLIQEINKEKLSQGKGDTLLMKLSCVQLFAKQNYEDIFLIWQAKQASFDSSISIDIQLLCAKGLENTKNYFNKLKDETAFEIKKVIEEREKQGDFEDFSYQNQMNYYINYYTN